MILKEEHVISTYVKQKCTIFYIPFRAKTSHDRILLEYY